MKDRKRVHFIAIGGYGMSAIAKVMLELGYEVTGSDLAQKELTDKLVAEGAVVYIGHAAEHVDGADFVVYSTALSKDNVEMKRAKQLQIPILHRSEMLAQLMSDRKGIAVAGAHGKTTTSSMLAYVMKECGLDPTYIIGGEVVNLGSNAQAGKGEYLIAEADESDRSFLHYHPALAVITNIEADHLENYNGDFNELKQAYAQFLSQVGDGRAVVNFDDGYVRELLPQLTCEVITFGMQPGADYVASQVVLGDRKSSFQVSRNGNVLGEVQLFVPGMHNVYNALSTIVTCLQAGIAFEDAAQALQRFIGAKRRFQIIGDHNDILIVDDYAHHPTEIITTIQAAKSTGKKVWAVFQPQRYTRTFFLFDEFSRAFVDADEVIITDIYSPAGEAQIEGVTSTRLVEKIKEHCAGNVHYVATKEEVHHFLAQRLKSGEMVLTMGAGDIWQTADSLAAELALKSS